MKTKNTLVLGLLLTLLFLPTLIISHPITENSVSTRGFIHTQTPPLQFSSNVINVTNPPLIADLYLNDTYFILAVSNDTLYSIKVVDDAKSILWEFKNPYNRKFVSSPISADFDGDGRLEVAIIDDEGCIYFLSANGDIITEISTDISPIQRPDNLGVFDINGDGSLDAVFISTRKVVIGDIFGHYEILHETSFDIVSGFIITDYDLDVNRTHGVIFTTKYNVIYVGINDTIQIAYLTHEIILIGSSGNYTVDITGVSPIEFSIISKDNRLIFFAFTNGTLEGIRYNITIPGLNETHIRPLTVDFDRDGLDEVFIVLKNGSAYIIGADGIEDSYFLGSNITSECAVTDYDGDTFPDLIVPLENGSILAIDKNSVITIDTLPEPRWPLIADIDDDGFIELIVIANSTLVIRDLNKVSPVDEWWTTYLHDIKRTNNFGTSPDKDGDGLPDNEDINPRDSDSDNDLAIDFTELFWLGTNPTLNDTDNDLLPDGWEVRYCLNPLFNDTDNDGELDSAEDMDMDNLTNLYEFRNRTNPLDNDTDDDELNDYEEIVKYNTDPSDPDTDDDGMPDGWEIRYSLNPLNSTDGLEDSDGDNVCNLDEYLNGTDPLDPDTDDDGMPDGWEIRYGLNPLDSADRTTDEDGDGLENLLEFKIGTNPIRNDTDHDGMSDGWEYTYGLNPIDGTDNVTDIDNDGLSNILEFQIGTNPRASDTDGDGIPDGWEYTYGLNPLKNDGYLDNDEDGLTNLDEYRYGTDPENPDTDNDGLTDSAEIYVYGTDPLNPDTDGDGLTDSAEIGIGTNPLESDSDGDGVSDYDELLAGTDPLDATDGLLNSLITIVPMILNIGLLIIIIAIIIKRKKRE